MKNIISFILAIFYFMAFNQNAFATENVTINVTLNQTSDSGTRIAPTFEATSTSCAGYKTSIIKVMTRPWPKNKTTAEVHITGLSKGTTHMTCTATNKKGDTKIFYNNVTVIVD